MTDQPRDRCEAAYEPWAERRSGTHTCNRQAGHDGAHQCPMCGRVWDEPALQSPE